MEFLTDYGLFFAKTLTLLVAVLIVIIVGAAVAMKDKDKRKLTIRKLNDVYKEMLDAVSEAVLSKSAFKKLQKEQKLFLCLILPTLLVLFCQ